MGEKALEERRERKEGEDWLVIQSRKPQRSSQGAGQGVGYEGSGKRMEKEGGGEPRDL